MLKITGLRLKRAAFHVAFLLHRDVRVAATVLASIVSAEKFFKGEVGA